MAEDFSLSDNGADIQKKMPISPTYLGITQLSKKKDLSFKSSNVFL